MKKLVSSQHVNPLSTICMKCGGSMFLTDSAERQSKVRKSYGIIPSDCVDSEIDGHKCPFITGKAFERVAQTQKIPQHCTDESAVC